MPANLAGKLPRFHAKWPRDYYGKTGLGRNATDRWPDRPLLLARGGQGRFCGVQLHIWNPLHAWAKTLASKHAKNISETGPIPDGFKGNSVGDFWWGEGDEKFSLDGEGFPSAFDTGSNVGVSRPDGYSGAAG